MGKEIEEQLFLQPGYLGLSSSPLLLCSVSGVGLIITVWDSRLKVGAMAHCFYDRPLFREKKSNYHVSVALENIKRFLRKKNSAGSVEVCLFGVGEKGGRVKKRLKKSISCVRKICAKSGFRIVSEDLGGERGRKVVFNTYTGETITLKTKDVRKQDWCLPSFASGGIMYD